MQSVWVVCLYTQGGVGDGQYILEFVRADDRDEAVANAVSLNEGEDGVTFEVMQVAKMPEDF